MLKLCQRWAALCSPAWFCSAVVSSSSSRRKRRKRRWSFAASVSRTSTPCWPVHPNTRQTTSSGRNLTVRVCRVCGYGCVAILQTRVTHHIALIATPSSLMQVFACKSTTTHWQISISGLIIWRLIPLGNVCQTTNPHINPKFQYCERYYLWVT